MKFIGITGGVGAGKSTILAYLRENYRVRTLVADEVAHEIMEPGYDCYVRLQKEFAQEKVWMRNGRFSRQRLADVIFSDKEKREKLNSIVHPAVKEYILKEVEKERLRGTTDYVVLEAALLIEEGYGQICDELWYVYVTEENRRQRLIENRGYSDEKIAQIFAAQLEEATYRRHCQVIIDNNGPVAQVYLQLAQLLNDKGEKQMERQVGQEANTQKEEQTYVFGLDIGTRNVVGTVGYKKEKEFIVVAQYSVEHETRAMLDGQIHDIGRVGRTISLVKEKLEDQIGQELTEVCIAAAGRVLKTVTTNVDYEYPEETVVTGEHIHTLDLLGIDKAAQELKEANDTKYKFYCVGYSVMKYYLNDEIFSNLESHKADKISEKIIVTFLPEDVVDGLYMAVGFAGLTVANMTLEPIAAMDVAVPEHFRMLNIALVDVGAGTSDICITRDGSITAYGMIPIAGDELTETIVQHYLVDFKMAEHIKLAAAGEADDEIEFEDIMSLKHTIPAQEVWKLTEPLVDKMTTEVAAKIKELNGDQTVSATFIVGGGGKIHGFDEQLAKKLELPKERVALRGAEVLKEVTFLQDEIEKDPLLVTPIGICLNYYEQKNNFIMVHFNGERLKLYDNNKLTIVDAAIQAGFPNDQLFPKRGREINFTVNGRPRIVRGEAGEAAIVRMNDRPASINDPIEPNCHITIEPSTAGSEAHYAVGQLEEYQGSTIVFEVNGKVVTCPRYVEVNGILEPPTYEIREGDAVVTRSFYTVQQLAEFMDVELDPYADIMVNNRVEDLQALVYENFSVDWSVLTYRSTPQDAYPDAPAHPRIPNLDDTDTSADSKDTDNGQAEDAGQLALPQKETGQEETLGAEDTQEGAQQTKSAGVSTDLAESDAAQNQAEGKAAQDGADAQGALEPTAALQVQGAAKPAASLQVQGASEPAAALQMQGAAVQTSEAQAGSAAAQIEGVRAGSTAVQTAGAQAGSAAVQTAGAQAGSTAVQATGAQAGSAAAQTAGAQSGSAAVQAAGVQAGSAAVQAAGVQAGSAAVQATGLQAGSASMQAAGTQAGSAPMQAAEVQSDSVPMQAEKVQAGGAQSGSAFMQAEAAQSGSTSTNHMPVSAGVQEHAAPKSTQTGSMPVTAASAEIQHGAAQTNGTQPAAANTAGSIAPAAGADAQNDPIQAAVARLSDGPTAQPIAKTQPQPAGEKAPQGNSAQQGFQVVVNGETIALGDKKEYIFVDVFDHIQFNLAEAHGRMLVTEINGMDAQYTQILQPGDKIDIYWKEI